MRFEIYCVAPEFDSWSWRLVHTTGRIIFQAGTPQFSAEACHEEIRKLPGYMKSASHVVLKREDV